MNRESGFKPFIKSWWPTLVSVAGLLLMSGVLYLMSRVEYDRVDAAVGEIMVQVRDSKLPELSVRKMVAAHLAAFERHDEFKEASFHLAVALFVSCIIVLCVEIVSRHRTNREAEAYKAIVAQSVYTALSGRLVSEEIAKELDGVMKSAVIRRNAVFTLTFHRPPGVPTDKVVVKRDLYYDLVNVTSSSRLFSVRSEITSEHGTTVIGDGKSRLELPRHISFSIDDEETPLEQDKTLQKDSDGEYRVLDVSVHLEPSKPRRIKLCAEELLPSRGENVYMQLHPVVDWACHVHNHLNGELMVKKVIMNHPRGSELARVHESHWIFKGGILPGQSFTVVWGPSGGESDGTGNA